MHCMFLRMILLVSFLPIAANAMNSGFLNERKRPVHSACDACRKAHASCDTKKPCTRCEARGIGDSCTEKPRNRKKLKKTKVAKATSTRKPDAEIRKRAWESQSDEFVEIPSRMTIEKPVVLSSDKSSDQEDSDDDELGLDELRNTFNSTTPLVLEPAVPFVAPLPEQVPSETRFPSTAALEVFPQINDLYDATDDEGMSWNELLKSMKEVDATYSSSRGEMPAPNVI